VVFSQKTLKNFHALAVFAKVVDCLFVMIQASLARSRAQHHSVLFDQ